MCHFGSTRFGSCYISLLFSILKNGYKLHYINNIITKIVNNIYDILMFKKYFRIKFKISHIFLNQIRLFILFKKNINVSDRVVQKA